MGVGRDFGVFQRFSVAPLFCSFSGAFWLQRYFPDPLPRGVLFLSYYYCYYYYFYYYYYYYYYYYLALWTP